MRTDRRIDAAARALGLAHSLVQLLAHAVQALELEGVMVRRHGEHGGDGVCIVSGELRIDVIGHRQQLSRAGDVGNVGVRLSGEDRIAIEAERLGTLDLGVPIGTFDQPHHDLAVELPSQRMEPVDDKATARAVGLDYHAEAVPAGKLRVGEHTLDDVERQVEPVGLLGVDIEAHARLAGGERQRKQSIGHDRQHGLPLRLLVARMQRREFHRDAGIETDVLAGRVFCQAQQWRSRRP